MNKTFGDLIRNKVEVYVNDIVVKTKEGSTLLEDLALVFDRLRTTRMKLNPEKCVFGVSAEKLLGFLVSHRGIEANPANIKAIEAMRLPDCIKDVQKLTGCLAALSRFISRLAEKALPFFKLLRGSGPFTWTEEAEQAFQELKQHLTSLPILVAPEPSEMLFLYLAASTEAVSMVLVVERAVQVSQGDSRLSTVKDDGPAIMEAEDGPESGGPDPNPGVWEWNQTRWGPKGQLPRILTWWSKASRAHMLGSRPSRSWSTTSAKSSMRLRPGTWRHISSFMLFS
jgi:hypothetical protein